MEREEIRQLLNGIFEIALNHPRIQLEDRMTADDIDNWDSLTNMTIISEIERQWQIHFKLRDIIRMKNVGDMIDTILAKSDQ